MAPSTEMIVPEPLATGVTSPPRISRATRWTTPDMIFLRASLDSAAPPSPGSKSDIASAAAARASEANPSLLMRMPMPQSPRSLDRQRVKDVRFQVLHASLRAVHCDDIHALAIQGGVLDGRGDGRGVVRRRLISIDILGK